MGLGLVYLDPAVSTRNSLRLRLKPRGDRQANAALYRIILSRLRWHQPTIDYMNRRLANGKTKREIIRCILAVLSRAFDQVFVAIGADAVRTPPGAP